MAASILGVAGAMLTRDFAVGSMQNYVSNVATGQQGNFASQTFQKRLSAIDYTLQWQGLHREDIRDLVQLTVGRMDIYHVVGTLLLTFGIQWFSTQMQNDDLEGFYTLFIISNFCSVGYLIMSVWLAMHASIAAQAIGCRLLTSYARLSIPSKNELDRISVSITPLLDQFLSLGKKALEKATGMHEAKVDMGPPIAEPPAAGHARQTSTFGSFPAVHRMKTAHVSGLCVAGGAAGEPQEANRMMRMGSVSDGSDAANQRQSPPRLHDRKHTEPPSGGLQPDDAGQNEWRPWDLDPRRMLERQRGARAEDCDIDRKRHFRRFLREQQRWLGYDAYARVCMSLGLNQMLQALSYCVLGIISQTSYVTAIGTFLGVKFLSVLILQLDMRGGITHWKEKAAVLFFFIVPPAFAAGVFWFQRIDKEWKDLAITICFFLHAAWAIHIYIETKPVPLLETGGQGLALVPSRFRAVSHLNVIKLTAGSADQGDPGDEHSLSEARKELERCIDEELTREACQGCVSSSGRRAEAAGTARCQLEWALEAAREASAEGKQVCEREMRHAHRALERLVVWERAPDVLASLEALRESGVQCWLEEDQKREIESSYQAFLRRCQELNLGLLAAPGQQGAADPLQETSVGTGTETLAALQLGEQKKRYVRVHTYHESLPASVWVKVATGELASASPHDVAETGAATSFVTALREADSLPAIAETHSASGNSEGLCDQITVRREQRRLEDAPAAAPTADFLPGKTVRRFAACNVCWWVLAGIVHICISIASLSGHKFLPDGTLVNVTWPAPALAFQVMSLQCNATHVLAQGPYAIHAAQRRSTDLSDFVKLSSVAQPGALLCGDAFGAGGSSGCYELHIWSAAGEGSAVAALRAVGVPSVGPTRRIEVPPSWLLPAAACVNAACASMILAAWDGSSVIVAMMSRIDGAPEASWSLEPRFQIAPGLAPQCTFTWPLEASSDAGGACLADTTGSQTYSSVSGLAMAPDGSVLTVLGSGGWLDGWDLEHARFLGRWRLRSTGAIATCHSGEELFFASIGARGSLPTLVAVSAPDALVLRVGGPRVHNMSGRAGCEGSPAVVIV